MVDTVSIRFLSNHVGPRIIPFHCTFVEVLERQGKVKAAALGLAQVYSRFTINPWEIRQSVLVANIALLHMRTLHDSLFFALRYAEASLLELAEIELTAADQFFQQRIKPTRQIDDIMLRLHAHDM